MRLHEFEAADIFENAGIPVPARGVAETPDEVKHIAADIGSPVLLKAQVLTGGRGLAGGIKTAKNPDEAFSLSETLFNTDIKGLQVGKILVSRKVEFQRELYTGITVDGYIGKPVVVVSSEGGVDIENVSKQSPDKIVSRHINVENGFFPYQARELLSDIGLSGKTLIQCAGILVNLYKVFNQYEAMITEINPVAVLPDGGIMALDAVLEIDDSAVGRLKGIVPVGNERIENPLERMGKEIGVSYVDLDGDIGIISSGAGLGMATMDIIGQRLKPANFLETGGGITEELLYECMKLVTMKKSLRAIVINIYGGINPIHEGARGIVRYIKENDLRIPVVAKALGNHQEETWDILRSGGVTVVTEVATERAIERLIELL
ncbi:succinate--CoA ligase subunit beta [Candidatus Latescibacterota bacterium]